MKTYFEHPEIKITKLVVEDIITLSGDLEGMEPDPDATVGDNLGI